MQLLLFPDPRPLVERLGREFFRQLPEAPGVYLMRDAGDAVLYVGKARNLRKRLGSYRVANPDRLPRRHLRLLRAVVRIELQQCADESAALVRETELLRSLKPRFNRAGTWSGPPRHLAWHCVGHRLELVVTELPQDSWTSHGPLGAGAPVLRRALVRLLWFALHPLLGVVGMPAGWAHGRFGETARLDCGDATEEITAKLAALAAGHPEDLCEWIRARLPARLTAFERALIDADLEHLAGPAEAEAPGQRSAAV
jgi:hypothetical protein